MKQLQNNFTTPEQSKRLLELGVPADSADCYIPFINYYNISPADGEKIFERWEYLDAVIWNKTKYPELIKDCEWTREFDGEEFDGHFTTYIPCWSVGRLIEIYNITTNLMPGMEIELNVEPQNCTYIELVIAAFELAADDGLNDFSLLEY